MIPAYHYRARRATEFMNFQGVHQNHAQNRAVARVSHWACKNCRIDQDKCRKGAEWGGKKHLSTLKSQLKREQRFGNEPEVDRYRELIKAYDAEMKRKRHPRMPVE